MINTNKHVKINQSKNTLFDDSNWSYLGQTIYQYRIHSFCRPGIHGPKPVGLGSSVSVRTSVGQQIGCIRPSTFILKDHPVSSCHLMSQNAIHFKRRFLVPSIFVRKECQVLPLESPESGRPPRLSRSLLYIRTVQFWLLLMSQEKGSSFQMITLSLLASKLGFLL